MVSLFNAKLAMDYLTGTPVEALAEREKLSVQRIYQRLNKTAYLVMGYSSITHAKSDDGRFAARLHDKVRIPDVFPRANTPEAFFHELLNEQRQTDY